MNITETSKPRGRTRTPKANQEGKVLAQQLAGLPNMSKRANDISENRRKRNPKALSGQALIQALARYAMHNPREYLAIFEANQARRAEALKAEKASKATQKASKHVRTLKVAPAKSTTEQPQVATA